MNRTRLTTLAFALLLALNPGGVMGQPEPARQASAPRATPSEAARKLTEAHEALKAAGLETEAEAIERIIKEVAESENENRPRGWRFGRGMHTPPGEGDKGGERVPSEISGLFREMFEITRGVDEHESRMRALRQREQQLIAEGNAPAARGEFTRLQAQIQQDRADALGRIRERAPKMRETIDRAIRSLEAQRSDDAAAPRMQFMRERLHAMRHALDQSAGDDEQFYNALSKFVEESRPRRMEPDKSGIEPPGERVARIEREIKVLQDRLRELEGELRRLREGEPAPRRDPPPPPPPAPGRRPLSPLN